ncbi:S1/P1 nuclease [Congregibacter variabilis]|uniref:S1/P1 nuclease n=1 Tax=Congregibacter variabilis TaxID=3081200 RepID=A0ABZ0I6X7_9GAMM|nr:S1/P1 nuclease [Congregibacter sp. IMCC43200]
MTPVTNTQKRLVETGTALTKPLALAVIVLSGVSPSPAVQAWGAMGHEIAAELASPYLSAHTQQELKALLGNESLASASTWADRMRKDPSWFWQKEAGPYHYVTVPRGRVYADVGPPAQGDAATALAQFARDLRDTSVSRARKQLAVRFAVHIIQDLQQPLHVGNGLDRGGNQLMVEFLGETSNLHRVWDRQIFETTGRSQEQWLDYFKSSDLVRPPSEQEAEPHLWIAQSAALRESLYPAPTIIGKDYVRRKLPMAEKQLALAGIRTAAWLNAIFDNSAAGRPPRSTEPAPLADKKMSWWQRIFRE